MTKEKFVPALTLGWLTPIYGWLAETFGFGIKFKNLVLDRLVIKKEGKLLDVGCGTGTLVILAKKRWPKMQVTGIDIDAKILSLARKGLAKQKINASLQRANAAKLPFTDRTFDAVVSTLMWHHMQTGVKRRAIKEVYRVLKKGSTFLLADWSLAPAWLRWLFRLLEPVAAEAKTVRDNLEGKLPVFLQEAGFKVKEIRPTYQGVQFWQATKSH